VRPKIVPPPPSFPSSPAATRSTIKLKVGGTQNDSHDTSKSKSRTRRPKDFDVPPPPYVDDGSHDLLQEVIAIEQEQIANRHRSGDKDPAAVAKHAISDDDEFLALASPSKEKATPHHPPAVAKEASSSTSKPPLDSNKAKKDKTGQSVVSSEAPAVSSSRKGKEKEVVPVTKPPKSRSTHTPFNEKKCKDVLKALMKLPEATIFARPVDPELDGCPT
jgi:transcription initiation factor TFIID subunit 2